MEENRKRKVKNSYGEGSVEYVATSEIEQDTFAFIWSLKNLSTLPANEEIYSPTFYGGPRTNHGWQLYVLPKKPVIIDGTTNTVRDHFSVNLRLKSRSNSSSAKSSVLPIPVQVIASYQISLLDPDDKPGKQTGFPMEFEDFYEWEPYWGRTIANDIALEELHNPSKRLVVDDTVRIHCRIWIKCEVVHTMHLGGIKPEASTGIIKEELLRGFKKMKLDFSSGLRASEFSDVSLVTSTKTFQAHKFVLTARSPVFRAMFLTTMLESTQNSVEIPDFEADVVESMLEYMYSGETPALNEKASDLFRISDKYELLGLKEDCEAALEDTLTIETAAGMLVLAHQHNAVMLKSKVIKYINRNKDMILETEGFKELVEPNAAILLELFLSK